MQELRNVIILHTEIREALLPLCEKYVAGIEIAEWMSKAIPNGDNNWLPICLESKETPDWLRRNAIDAILENLPGNNKKIVIMKQWEHAWYVEYAVDR